MQLLMSGSHGNAMCAICDTVSKQINSVILLTHSSTCLQIHFPSAENLNHSERIVRKHLEKKARRFLGLISIRKSECNLLHRISNHGDLAGLKESHLSDTENSDLLTP